MRHPLAFLFDGKIGIVSLVMAKRFYDRSEGPQERNFDTMAPYGFFLFDFPFSIKCI